MSSETAPTDEQPTNGGLPPVASENFETDLAPLRKRTDLSHIEHLAAAVAPGYIAKDLTPEKVAARSLQVVTALLRITRS